MVSKLFVFEFFIEKSAQEVTLSYSGLFGVYWVSLQNNLNLEYVKIQASTLTPIGVHTPFVHAYKPGHSFWHDPNFRVQNGGYWRNIKVGKLYLGISRKKAVQFVLLHVFFYIQSPKKMLPTWISEGVFHD